MPLRRRSFCRRHGVVGTSDPAGQVAFEVGDASLVRYYRFAQKSAQFMLCGECGVFVAALTETAPGDRAVINARAPMDPGHREGLMTTVSKAA